MISPPLFPFSPPPPFLSPLASMPSLDKSAETFFKRFLAKLCKTANFRKKRYRCINSRFQRYAKQNFVCQGFCKSGFQRLRYQEGGVVGVVGVGRVSDHLWKSDHSVVCCAELKEVGALSVSWILRSPPSNEGGSSKKHPKWQVRSPPGNQPPNTKHHKVGLA